MAYRQALTIAGDGLLKYLPSQIEICTPVTDLSKGPEKSSGQLMGIWDTGATGSVITQKVVDILKLEPIGLTQVNTASGQETSPVYLVDMILPNKVLIQGLRVTLGRLTEADTLIGMDVICCGDFSITNIAGKTKMSFRIPSCVEIDYVKEIQANPPILVGKDGVSLSRQQRRKLAREQAKTGHNS